MILGFDISSMSAIIDTAQYIEYFNAPSPMLQGWIVASMPVGSFWGALAAGYMGDKFGRKYTIQMSCVLWCFGSIIQACAPSVKILLVGRFIAGAAAGISSSIVPVYISEIAPKRNRGRLIGFQQWAITWGILIMYLIQLGTSNIPGEMSFRVAWALQVVPGLVLGLGLFLMPRSPRWLANNGLWEEAHEVLATLHSHGDRADMSVRNELQVIRTNTEEEQVMYSQKPWREILRPRIFKRVLLGMAIQAWSQLSGMNLMMYYIVYIMQSAGSKCPIVSATIQYVINCVMGVLPLIYLDRWGRRPTILCGSAMIMVCLFSIGAIMGIYGEKGTIGTTTTWVISDNRHAGNAVIALSFLSVATFAVSYGPVSWVYPAEIFPTNVRSVAVSLSTSTNWAVKFLLAWLVPMCLHSLPYQTYFLFGTFNILAFIHMFFCAYETKGHSLEDITLMLDSRVSPLRSKSWVAPAQSTHNWNNKTDAVHQERIIVEDK